MNRRSLLKSALLLAGARIGLPVGLARAATESNRWHHGLSRLGELKYRLRELPRDQEIVAYCRGPYCVLSYEAVAELRRRGFKAFRLEDGYPEWKAAGLPTHNSAAG